MEIQLNRLDETRHGVFGEMIISGHRFKTVERLFKDNQPFISSIPPGKYTLEPHESNQHGQTWALVNHDLGVYHYQDAKAKRTAILIHVANRASELAGCIGLGKYLGFVSDEIAVTNSAAAVGDALEILSKDTNHTITIRDKL